MNISHGSKNPADSFEIKGFSGLSFCRPDQRRISSFSAKPFYSASKVIVTEALRMSFAAWTIVPPASSAAMALAEKFPIELS